MALNVLTIRAQRIDCRSTCLRGYWLIEVGDVAEEARVEELYQKLFGCIYQASLSTSYVSMIIPASSPFGQQIYAV